MEIDVENINKIVSDVLGVPVELITDDSSPDTIDQWTSLAHINLIVTLESEFEIKLLPEDVIDMLSVKLIRLIIADYLQNKHD